MRATNAVVVSTATCLCLFPLALSHRTLAADFTPADMTAREVAQELFKATSDHPLDFSSRNLQYLDLSGLDFKGAKLAGADLYGVDLTGSKLAGADLSKTRLDRATLIRADFTGANLSDTTILRPTIYSDLSADLADAPRFTAANLARVRVTAQLDGADFSGADLSGADFSSREVRPGQGTISTLMKNLLRGCNFTNAKLRGANLEHAILRFADLSGADLTGANFAGADLSKANFTGADLTGADLTGADLDGANLTGVKGLGSVKGLDQTVNFDRAAR